MTSTTLPPPPPSMVYANVLEYPKHRGRVTPQTWLMALEQLQDTREARAAMRDVWAWEQAGCPLPEEREPERIVLDTRTCDQCGASFVPSVSRQVYCTSRCRMANRPSRANGTETAFCANPECGLGFDRTNPKKAYCCERCSSRAAYLIRKSKEARQ
jgi:hypothetical protein